jgi:diguanylate cyclase (GGDEF)-like protein
MAPTVAFFVACMLVTIFIITFGVGNLSSLLWLAVIPNVIFMFLKFRQALIILFSNLAVMVVLYLTPLAEALHLEFNVLFSRWNVLLVYSVFFFICGNLEFLRHLTNLKLEESRKEILRLSFLDDLTKIFNRRSFDNALLELWNSPLSGKNKTSLLMIDIDNFKMYNDNFGHLQGDKVLTRIALTISEVITNETYTLARYGGEELVVLMPGTDCLSATSLAEGMKTAVSALGLTYYDTAEAASKILSISIGVATEELNRLESAETLIRIADENLYRAKRNGKNAVWSSLNHQIGS